MGRSCVTYTSSLDIYCTALIFRRYLGMFFSTPPPGPGSRPPLPLLDLLLCPVGETYKIRDHKYSKMGKGVAYANGVPVAPPTMTTCTGEALSNVSRGDYRIPDRRFGMRVL